MIDRNIKEPLYLRSVQVNCQNTLRTSLRNDVRNQLRRDRHTRTIFFIRAGVTKIRDNRSHSFRRSTNKRIEHDEQFHQMLIARRACRLNNKNIVPANILADRKIELTIGKPLGDGLSGFNIKMPTYLPGKRRMRIAEENLYLSIDAHALSSKFKVSSSK